MDVAPLPLNETAKEPATQKGESPGPRMTGPACQVPTAFETSLLGAGSERGDPLPGAVPPPTSEFPAGCTAAPGLGFVGFRLRNSVALRHSRPSRGSPSRSAPHLPASTSRDRTRVTRLRLGVILH